MVVKLDVKDRKILYELDINSRQSNSEIAKKVGLSKQVVGFRIKRLLKENIISFFYSVIDISKLGFTVHKNFLRLQNLDRGKEKELIDFLVNHPNVVWFASCDGKFDLAFGTWAKELSPQSVIKKGKRGSTKVAYKLTTFGEAKAKNLLKEI